MPLNLGQLGNNGQYYDATTHRAYVPIYSGSAYAGSMDQLAPQQVSGYRGYEWAPGMYSDPSKINGKPYDELDTQGNKTGQGVWSGLPKDGLLEDAVKVAAAAAAMYGGASMLGGASGGLGGAAMGAPTEAAYASQIAGFENSLAPYLSGGMQTSAMGAGAEGFGSPMGPPTASEYGSQIGGFENSLSQYAPGSTMGPPTQGMYNQQIAGFEQKLAPYLTGLTPTAAKGLTDTVRGLLGPAATALGALAGSQGQQTGQESVKKMDPRLDEYVYGSLLPAVKAKAQADMSPDRQAMWDKMRGAGLGLLSAPAAGNAFDRFYGGK